MKKGFALSAVMMTAFLLVLVSLALFTGPGAQAAFESSSLGRETAVVPQNRILSPAFSGAILAPAANWTAFVPQDANFGLALAGVGDVNGDGFADVVVGADWYDHGEVDEGAVFLYLGAPEGLSAEPAWQYESNMDNRELGHVVAGAGDVNGDGFDDLLVGANSPLPDVGGKVYLFWGAPDGLEPEPAWFVTGEQLEDGFGTAVAGAGDVNDDGYDDIILGAPHYVDSSAVEVGRVYVYYGSPVGPAAAPDWVAESDLPLSRFGGAVAGAGDVDNDGYDDVIIGASDYDADGQVGMAALFLGDATGLPAAGAVATVSDAASVVHGDYALFSQFGFAVGPAGDVNGDGYDDVLIGAPAYGDQTMIYGAAYLYYGAAAGLGSPPSLLSEYTSGSMYGFAVHTAGDVNRDGFADVIVGAPEFPPIFAPDGQVARQQVGSGAAFVYLGASWGVAPYANWTGASMITGTHYGTAVGAAGDVNGDGYDDFLVGAPEFPNPADFKGMAFGYYGSGVVSSLTAVNSSPTPFGQPTFFQAVVMDGGFLQYEWAFGDGMTATGKSVSHLYSAPGLYTAVVTATSLTDIMTATTAVTITVDATITPGAGGELSFTDPTTGLGLNVNVPPGAVGDLLRLAYTPLAMIPQPSPTNTIGYYFDLDAVEPLRLFLPLVVGEGSGGRGTAVLPASAPFQTNSFPFLEPVSVTIFYNEDLLPPGAGETDMKLLFWDVPSQTWIDMATSCSPTSTYTYNPAENWFRVDICHLSRLSVVH